MKKNLSGKAANPLNQVIYDSFNELYQKYMKNNENHKFQTTKKVLQNLEKFPLPILNGAMACKYLAGIGDKYRSKIDKMLKQSSDLKRKIEDFDQPQVKRIPKQQTQQVLSQIISQQQVMPGNIEATNSTLEYLFKNKYIENNEEGKIVCTQKGLKVSQSLNKQNESLTQQNVDFSNFNPDDILLKPTKQTVEVQSQFIFKNEQASSVAIRDDNSILNFEVQLIIDSNERHANNFDIWLDNLQQQIPAKKIRLGIGDYHWVVNITDLNSKVQTYSLQYIVERKTMDDLASSIRDGRYEEQPIRMKYSGLNVIYLIEGKQISNNF